MIESREKLAKFILLLMMFSCMGFAAHISNLELDEIIRMDEKYSHVCDACETPDEKSKCELSKDILADSQESMSSITTLAKWYSIAFMFVIVLLMMFEWKAKADVAREDRK